MGVQPESSSVFPSGYRSDQIPRRMSSIGNPQNDAATTSHWSSEVRFNPPAVFTFIVLLTMLSRLVWAVCRYCVNLVFWDQWDFYTPLFNHASLWQIFTWEHSPHREGIGLVLDKFVLEWSDWSSLAEALFMVGALLAAALLALLLKRRLLGRLGYSDLVIPCLFLTFAQLEALIGEANPSYSAFPELLIVLSCLAWLIPKPVARYGVLLALNFLLIYTGFGIFMGVVTVGVLLFELRRVVRAKAESWRVVVVALLLAGLSLASFFYHYRWDPTISCRFPDHHPLNYGWFVSLLMSYFLGLRAVVPATAVGIAVALVAVAILIWHGVHLWKSREFSPVDLTVVTLLSFSLIFAANAAMGRVCFGLPEAAQFSRYMGLLVPAFLGIYFHLLTWPSTWRRTASLAVFAIAIIPGTVRTPAGYSPEAVSNGKRVWRACILQTGNIDLCDRATQFPAHPNPRKTHMLEKLQFLQKNRLNLYSDGQ